MTRRERGWRLVVAGVAITMVGIAGYLISLACSALDIFSRFSQTTTRITNGDGLAHYVLS